MNPAKPKTRPINLNAHEVRVVLDAKRTGPRDSPGVPPVIVQLVDPQPSAEMVGYSWCISTDKKRDRCFIPRRHDGPRSHYPQFECGDPIWCPFGFPGDQVWVRETWALIDKSIDLDGSDVVTEYRADTDDDKYPGGWPSDEGDHDLCPRWRSSTHMPRNHSRLLLEVVDVRIVRLRLGGFGREFKSSALRRPFVWVVQLGILPGDTETK